MTQEGIYTLAELADTSGVPPRTIRFYTTEGVLPPPLRGRFAMYGTTHYHRLQLIQALKRALVPLILMRRHLPRLSDAQIIALLKTIPLEESASENSVAGVTLQASNSGITEPSILDKDYTRTDSLKVEPEYLTSPPSEASILAYKTLAGVLAIRPPIIQAPIIQEQNSVESSSIDHSDNSDLSDLPDHSPTPRRALLVSPLLAPDSSEPETSIQQPATEFQMSSHETWQRILLASGVELHVRVPENDAERDHLERVIADARALFQK